MIEQFKQFLGDWIVMCVAPIGNTIILYNLDNNFIRVIKENLSNFIIEEDDYYVIDYIGNTIKIKKND